MKCVRLYQYGGVDQFRVEEIEPPRPGPGEVLIDIAAAAVNPVDTKLRSGVLKDWLPLAFPCVLGADFSGTIVAVGPGINSDRVGERVMGMVSVLRGGAYAEQMVVGADEAIRMPDELDLVDAAALPMGVMTGYDLIQEGLNVRAGERVIVTGAGGSVGRAAAFAASERGAQVIALVRTMPDTTISGASATILISDKEAVSENGPFDCIADTIGGSAAEALIDYLKPNGRFSTVVSQMPIVPEGPISVSRVIVKANGSNLARFATAVTSGVVSLPSARRFPLEGAAEAHRMLEAGGIGSKLLLVA